MTAKAFTAGTHRAVPPEVTVERSAPWLDRLGITRVADITGLDRIGIPVMAAYRPEAWSLAVSLGKGVTPAAAHASAVMESIELWHAENPALPLRWGPAEDLGLDYRFVDWSALPRPAGREFDASTPTAWASAASLIDGEPSLVPFESVHTDGRDPEPPGSGWFACTSNGLASGNNPAEAKLHALCEVVERDAIALWRLAGDATATAIDPSTVSDPVCRQLLDRLDRAGVAALLHDASSDVGMATVHCTLFEPGTDPAGFVHTATGMGCHPAPGVAVSRAITEAAQSRLTFISGARDDMFRTKYAVPDDAARQAGQLTALWEGAAGAAGRSFDDLADLASDSLEGDLEAVVGVLGRAGFDPHWVDLTQRPIGIAVGRAVVAGLENIADGCGPGRRAAEAAAGLRR